MKNVGRISVVVPIYNQEKYLERSIPSIQKQQYKELEIILVDDGSTDSSAEIIKKYAEIDPRIIVVSQNNSGLVAATIAGCQVARGEYIAFLDPDDYYGEDFLANFVKEVVEDYDFIAAGFYYDDDGQLSPQYLKCTQEFNETMIEKLKRTYLYSPDYEGISSEIFISRWNKLYRSDVVKKVIQEFKKCRGITLGEDTIFTFLMLKYCKKGKSIGRANSYYYNIGNQNSMMKNEAVEKHLDSAIKAFKIYGEILRQDGIESTQANILYFYLVESLLARFEKNNMKIAANIYSRLWRNKIYQKAVKVQYKNSKRKKTKIKLGLKRYCPFGSIYFYMANNGIEWFHKIKEICLDGKFLTKNVRRVGIAKTKKLYHFHMNRRHAFCDIQEQLPLLEKRINQIIQPLLYLKTDLEKCPIRDNIFVFWMDGFDNAPVIVQKCLQSIKDYHPNSNIIEISKSNYKKYTDINPVLLKDFENGEISIQTFSDILRFNLLKNHGGTWIDATIFFCDDFDLTNNLKNKSIESICFSTTKKFLQYKGECCSWSGFFFAARKNAAFVRVMDYIFEQYYLKYHTFSIYFFIDVALMVCKLNHIDQDALAKIQRNSGDMFTLNRILNEEYDEKYQYEIIKVPQKLTWDCDVSRFSSYSVYSVVIERK